jgi:predicted acylesterase/phospholipase RssA
VIVPVTATGSAGAVVASCATAMSDMLLSTTRMTAPTRDSRNVRMIIPHCPAGRVRQWLDAVPAARVWAACQSLPLASYDGSGLRRVQESEVGKPTQCGYSVVGSSGSGIGVISPARMAPSRTFVTAPPASSWGRSVRTAWKPS